MRYVLVGQAADALPWNQGRIVAALIAVITIMVLVSALLLLGKAGKMKISDVIVGALKVLVCLAVAALAAGGLVYGERIVTFVSGG